MALLDNTGLNYANNPLYPNGKIFLNKESRWRKNYEGSAGLIWDKATDEDKHKELLYGMIEAVYIDLAASRSIVGIQPKPPFHNLFESLKHVPDNKVIIFRPGVEQKETGPGIAQEPDFKLVETGEASSPSYHTISSLLTQRRALAIDFKRQVIC